MKHIRWKTVAFSLLATAATVAGATKAALTLDEVNAKVAELLTPFNSNVSTATLTFKSLKVDAERARHFAADAVFTKLGAHNRLELLVPEFSYTNEVGQAAPELRGSLRMKLDLVKAFSQDWIDKMAPASDALLRDLAQSFLEDYGNAVTIDSSIDELVKDENDHVVSLKLHFTATIDLSQLPETSPTTEMPVQSFTIRADASRTEAGLTIAAKMNPGYSGFESDEKGFKEVIEAITAGDKNTYNDIRQMAAWLDQMAGQLVDRQAE